MKPRIAIVDYGMGNLRSVQKAIERVGYPAEITQSPQIIRNATHVVVPGQGAFCDAKQCLEDNKLTGEVIKAIASGKPFLGICLGLQLLLSVSYENGTYEGLNVIPGEVVKFQGKMKIPHIGWNQLILKKQGVIFEGIADQSYAYFDHSYYVKPTDPSVIAITTDYEGEFTSMIWKDNIIATQFHPEKSQKVGLQILTNFGKMS
jgi:imidazole glycerol-phosphate synthase subunit HisH